MHDYKTCERCQLDLALWGEAMVDDRTGEHMDVQHLIRFHGDPQPAFMEAFKARMGVDK